MSALRCTIVKPNGKPCGRKIVAWTGLQELNKLEAHVRRCHGQSLGMMTMLDMRIKMENGESIYTRESRHHAMKAKP